MILDASAWIEFFLDTEKSQKVEDVIKEGNCFTSVVTIAEIANWCCRSGAENKIQAYVEGIKNNSQILGLNWTISMIAGKLNYERKKSGKKWGMIDSMIVATAQAYGLKVLTKDNGFRDLPEAQVL